MDKLQEHFSKLLQETTTGFHRYMTILSSVLLLCLFLFCQARKAAYLR